MTRTLVVAAVSLTTIYCGSLALAGFGTLRAVPAALAGSRSGLDPSTVVTSPRPTLGIAPTATAVPTDVPTETTNLPTPTPTASSVRQPVFRIVAVRAELPASSADWSFRNPAVQQVPVGTAVNVSVYAAFTHLPAQARVSVRSAVTYGRAIVHRAGVSGRVNEAQAGRVWQHSRFTPRSAGAYVVTAIVRVNDRIERATASFTALAPRGRTGPIFRFDGLASLNTRGSPASTFLPSERVVILVRWTLLGSGGARTVSLTEALQSSTARGWLTLGSPLQNVFDEGTGSHQFAFSFVPGTTHSSLRIVIEINVQGQVEQRAVVIRVRT